uniref:Uncharacterized protein n=1 Tax=Rhizophora mucronata TaxID=61149 RepID=A0A2P2QIY3_RHIMU
MYMLPYADFFKLEQVQLNFSFLFTRSLHSDKFQLSKTPILIISQK